MKEENYKLKDCSDEELIKLIQINKVKDSPTAKKAYGELYFRYAKDLMNLCERATMNTSYADDVFEKTWSKVYKYASYSSGSGKFFTWLSKIAQNVYYSIRKKQLNIIDIEDPKYNNIPEREEAGQQLPTFEHKLVEEAMSKLSPRDEDVLLTYLQYAPDKNDHLSKEQLEILKNKHKTTSANLRMIKKRAVDSIKIYIEQHR